MDFFSAVHHGDQRPAPTDAPDVAVFANAVASRHGNGDAATLLRTRLTPVTELPMPLPESPMANMSLAPATPSAFKSVHVSSLSEYLDDPATLILDIRSHAAYTDARLPRALSLSVPSTLLKRPLFSLERLAAMLPSASDRARFLAFRDSSRILVHDADAVYIPESSNIHGLLRKFKAAHYTGELCWLRGGFQCVWREQRHLVDATPQIKDHEDDDDQDSGPADPTSPTPIRPAVLRTKHLPKSAFSVSSTTASQSPTGSKRRPPLPNHHSSMPLHMSLPMSTSLPTTRPAINPFFDTIRQNVELSHGITERIPLRLPARVRRRIADLPFPWLQEVARRADRVPRVYRPHHHHRPPSFECFDLPPHLAHPPGSHPPTSSSSASSCSDSDESSDSDVFSPSPALVEEGTEALAMQFYRIELAEQRRLMGVMEHHSKESGRFVADGVYEETHASSAFPFSITAGVEKGVKNRYRHIWPFEHARVRLHTTRLEISTDKGKHEATMEEDDYVNASYVQPLGTNRRYIATQGPLEATFDDFWRLAWEQNVHVIVMLTKEIEGSMVKCGTYWADTKHPEHERRFGPLRLTLISKVGLPAGVDLMHGDPESVHMSTQDGLGVAGGFAFPSSGHPHKHKSHKRRMTTIKRTFALSHAGYPHLGARTVVQLQYLEWPDMNVPDDPRGVLGLVKEVESAVRETDACASPVSKSPGLEEMDDGKAGVGRKAMRVDPGSGIARHALGGCRPVLLHCSAGVGRTGGFIAVDAVLDAIRLEMRRVKEMEDGKAIVKGKEREVAAEVVAMDVDEPPSGPGPVVYPTGQDKMVIVPLPVSANADLNVDAGRNVDDGEGLVVHVPAVVVPASASTTDAQHSPPLDVTHVDAPRTPMQTDRDEVSPDSEDVDVRQSALTRKWAESVSGSYSSAKASTSASQPLSSLSPPPPSSHVSLSASVSGTVPAPRHPQPWAQQRKPLPPAAVSTTLTSSTSSSSASPLPLTSDSDDSLGKRRLRGETLSGYPGGSSLETSVSGASVASDKERQKELQQLDEHGKTETTQQHGLQRSRTLSAPQPPARNKFHLSLGLSGAGGVGSSPLAKLAGEAQPPQDVTDEGTTDQENTASVSVPIPCPHPLSRSSPPLGAAHSLPDTQPPAYVPDPRVSSSFPERPTTTVDYKEPRALHGAPKTPVSLSQFEEPIWEVVQDMREQRMSLCQSLRQYVFVHAAIIEGALWIVDEERERERQKDGEKVLPGEREDEVMAVAEPVQEKKNEAGSGGRAVSPTASPRFTYGASSSDNTRSPRTLSRSSPSSSRVFRPSLPPLPIPPVPQFERFNSNSSAGMSDSGSTSSTGKRGASPTELLKEGKQGEVLLSKRPSIKRKVQTPSPGLDVENAMSGDPVHARSPGTPSKAVASPLQLMTVPSSPMPCE